MQTRIEMPGLAMAGDGETILVLLGTAVLPCRTSGRRMKRTRLIAVGTDADAESIYWFNVSISSVSLGKNVLVNQTKHLSAMGRAVMRRLSAV